MRALSASVLVTSWALLLCHGGVGKLLPEVQFVRVADLGPSGGEPQRETPRQMGDHPIEVRREDYQSVQPAMLRIMPRTGAAGDPDGARRREFYIPRAGQGGLLSRLAGNFREIRGGMEDGLAAVFIDYDHSGRQSLLVAGSNGIALYHNDGRSRFSAVTQKAGLPVEVGLVCAGVAVDDFDADGFPDLVVAVYTDLNRPPSKPVVTFPNDFAGVSSRLYRNNRNGTFTDVTQSAGLGGGVGRARKAIVADFNQDGRPDILLLRDDRPPALYRNRGGWKFDNVTWDAGDALTTHAFFEGAAVDFNRDGKPDLVLWSTHTCRLLINQGNATFKRLVSTSIPEPEISVFRFRGLAGDLNGDGFDDLVTVDQSGRLHAFVNDAGKFHEVSLEVPRGMENGFLSWFPANGHRGIYVLAKQSDGHIALLQSKVQ